MLVVKNDGSIQLTRGDSAEFEVLITNKVDGSEYTIQPGDSLTFTMKKSLKVQAPIIFQQTIHSNLFVLEHRDTNGLEFGDYYYDVQLTTAEGKVFTVVPPSRFKITPEVTCSNDS